MSTSTDKYTKLCFGGADRFTASDQYPKRFDITQSLAELANKRIIYMQNIKDHHHYDIHFRRFCEAFDIERQENLRSGNIRTILFDDPKGHTVAETPEAFQKALKIIMNDFAK
jgi:hypothetical protein